MAVLDHSGDLVAACDASHKLHSGHRSGKAAVLDLTAIYACDSSHDTAAPRWNDLSADGQIPHGRLPFKITEQSHCRTLPGNIQAFDRISAALKAAAKDRNTGKIHSGQINVRLQLHGQSLAVAVKTTILGKREKFFHRGNGQCFLRCFRRCFRQRFFFLSKYGQNGYRRQTGTDKDSCQHDLSFIDDFICDLTHAAPPSDSYFHRLHCSLWPNFPALHHSPYPRSRSPWIWPH